MTPLRNRRRRVVAAVTFWTLLSFSCGTRLTQEELEVIPLLGVGEQFPQPGSSTPAAAPEQAPGSGSDAGPAMAPAELSTGSIAGPALGGQGAPTATAGPSEAATSSPAINAGPQPLVADKSPVMIGSIGTYTGLVGAILARGRTMAQVWAQSVNERGGLNGHPVHLVTADDTGDPAKAQALVKQMVEEQGVIAFVGNMTSLTTQGYAGYLASAGVPAVGGDLLQEIWFDNPMLFPNSIGLRSLVFGEVAMVVGEGVSKIGILYCSEAAVCTDANRYLDGAASQAGATVAYRRQISLAQTTYASECIQARGAGAEALLLAMTADAAKRVVADCKSQGYSPLFASGAIAMDTTLADGDTDGFIVASQAFPFILADGPASEYASAAATFAPDLVLSGVTAQVWAAGKMLEDASANLPESPTAADIVAGLYALPPGYDMDGLSSPMTFTKGSPPQAQDCYFVVKVVDGEWTAPHGMKRFCG